MSKVLVVDDQRNLRATLVMMLRGAGYDVDEAGDADEGCDLATKGAYDVVLTDLRLGPGDGLRVLRAAREIPGPPEVIVMTAFGTIESAVEAMRDGAFDYVEKPFGERELVVKVEKALEKRRLEGQVQAFASEFKERYGFANVVGRSQALRDLLARVVKIAPTDATVLITGESGTGKELVAKAIHASSRRADRPFIPVNCAAISDTLLESELFGHARGAFTGAASARKGMFEEADGGTFFFDEISETTPAFQAKLLRALQEGEIRRLGENRPILVDVRVIAATNQDLLAAVADKRFRQDLYYRLAVARLHLPPLRERREDIAQLAAFFLDKYNRKMGRRARLGDGVLEALGAYDYPGNVRELENMIEQAVALSGDGPLSVDDVVPTAPGAERTPPASGRSLAHAVDEAERATILGALRDTDGSRERAAEVLGISPTTLWRKMTRLAISFD